MTCPGGSVAQGSGGFSSCLRVHSMYSGSVVCPGIGGKEVLVRLILGWSHGDHECRMVGRQGRSTCPSRCCL